MNVMCSDSVPKKLKGKLVAVERTGESVKRAGENWQKCIFTLELTGFSARTPTQQIPVNLKGKKVKIVRYCLYDWHYKLGADKTLEPEETEIILHGKPSDTVWW